MWQFYEKSLSRHEYIEHADKNVHYKTWEKSEEGICRFEKRVEEHEILWVITDDD